MDIDLHLDESIGEVPLIAEDFSRMKLNLVNYAFDAMREKPVKIEGSNPSPRVITLEEVTSEHSNTSVRAKGTPSGLARGREDLRWIIRVWISTFIAD